MNKPARIVFCCPTYNRPKPQFIESLEKTVPLLEEAGFEHGLTFEVGSAYLARARSDMLRRALNSSADHVVFLDDDLSWTPESLLKLVQAPGDVVAGTYRYKEPGERYMGYFYQVGGNPCTRFDGAIEADRVPAGFLRVSKEAVDLFMERWPELCYGPRYALAVDLFNHGAHEGVWWGEDYSFSRRYREAGGEIWLLPDLDITHHDKDGTEYPGNLHKFIIKERLKCASSLPAQPALSDTTLPTTSSNTRIGKSRSSTGSTTRATSTGSRKSACPTRG